MVLHPVGIGYGLSHELVVLVVLTLAFGRGSDSRWDLADQPCHVSHEGFTQVRDHGSLSDSHHIRVQKGPIPPQEQVRLADSLLPLGVRLRVGVPEVEQVPVSYTHL